MKKLFALMTAVLLICSAAMAENAGDVPDFRTLAGLDRLEEKLSTGVVIERIYYTDGYGFSTSEFTTTDEAEIRQLWEALYRITVRGRTDESITDWYPQIVFYLSDGTMAHVSFESHWLSLPTPWPQANYELENDGAFWKLTAALVSRYESSVHPKETYLKIPPEGTCRIGVREAVEDHIDLALYTEDLYSRGEIESLSPGDTVVVDGKTYTAASIVFHGSGDSEGKGKFELIPEEEFDGYIVFEAVSECDFRAVVNDRIPCTYAGRTTVQLPLPDGFVFRDYADYEGGAPEFLDDVSADRYTPYNTVARFEDGMLVEVCHTDYPAGPED